MAGQDEKISGLNKIGTIQGNELIEAVQNGVNKRTDPDQLKDYIGQDFIPKGDVDSITFNLDPPVITTDGTILWNKNEYTIDVITGLGATIQVGQETLILWYNNTGSTITNGQVLRPNAATVISGYTLPTPELAKSDEHTTCDGTLSVATHDILDGALGFSTIFGRVRGLDTSSFSAGGDVWLSSTIAGAITPNKPAFPEFPISLGGALNSESAPDGEIIINVRGSVNDTFNDGWDGAIRESFDFLVTSNGTVVTGTLINVDPLLNLDCIFSDVGLYTFDTTTSPATITLTAGTDSIPVSNYVYIPISTKILTVSTSGFPTTEHCKVAQLEVQSAATVQAESGAVRNQNINDHIKKEDDNGHILHIAERVRQLNAEHDNGTEGSLTGTPTNGYIQVTGGQVWQMHKQTFVSFSMPTRNIIITNDFTTPNRRTDNLNTITAYSTGSTWNNEWSKVVVWGVVNKTGEPDFVQLNLPSDGYNSEANAISDSLNYADYSIPKKYKGVGFLIAAFTVRISGGTVTYNGGSAYQDLRGFIPNNIAGGGGGSGVTSLLGLSDVFISDYAGKAGYELLVNDLETGIDATAKPLAGAGIANGGVSNLAQTFEGEKMFIDKIDVSKSQNTGTTISVENTNTGVGAFSRYILSNNISNVGYLNAYGSNYTAAPNFADSLVLNTVSGRTLYLFSSGKISIRNATNADVLNIENSKVYIIPTPTIDNSNSPIIVRDSSTGELKIQDNSYSALTADPAVSYNLFTGLKKTLSVAVDTTITFTNFESGMQGVIRLNVTVISDIIFAASGVTFYGKGTFTDLAVGRHAIAYEWISTTECLVNIGSIYESL